MEDSRTLQLSGSLEDYLETVYLLVQKHRFARVRDIAETRNVKAGSVVPALRRLSELGLVNYAKHEYVQLTSEGEKQALRILARHQVLSRFFSEFLQMPPDIADRDACSMEHSLSNEGMDRFVRFLEYVSVCPAGAADVLRRFHNCARVQQGIAECVSPCPATGPGITPAGDPTQGLHTLKPGTQGRIVQVNATGPVRQRMLDMGLLPDVQVSVQRVAPGGDPIWILVQGAQLALRRREAEAVLVTPVAGVDQAW